MITELLKSIFFLPTTLLAFFQSFGRDNHRHLGLQQIAMAHSKQLMTSVDELVEVRIGSVIIVDSLLRRMFGDYSRSLTIRDVMDAVHDGKLCTNLTLQVALGNYIFKGTTNPLRMGDEVVKLVTRYGLITVVESIQVTAQLQNHMADTNRDMVECRRGAIFCVSDYVANYRRIGYGDMALRQCLNCIKNNDTYTNTVLQAKLRNFIENDVTPPKDMHEPVLAIALQEGIITIEEAERVRLDIENKMRDIVSKCN